MKVFVFVKTKAREDKVEKIDENHFKVKVKELPVDGKANKKVLRLVADYFKVPLSNITITSGHKGSRKRILINLEAKK
jgi:hypothetical protein